MVIPQGGDSSRCIQMAFVFTTCLCGLVYASEEAEDSLNQLSGDSAREGKTLINQFPFNQQTNNHGHHGHHGDHHGDHHADHHADHHPHHQLTRSQFASSDELPSRLDNRLGKQSADNDENAFDLDIGTVAAAGKRCVKKVMMVEELVYDDHIECHHSYDQQCHTTYTTDYVPQQMENCDENFVKECFIEYKPVAFNETVEICNELPVREECGDAGPIVCEKVYASHCETTHHVHEVEDQVPVCNTVMMKKCNPVTQGYTTKEVCDEWPVQQCTVEEKTVKKHTPDTKCDKKPFEVCGPGPCPITAGKKQCRNEKKTVVQDRPEESCSLRAQPFCEYETKLVPVLKPRENCVDVPKEVCVRMRSNPRKVKKPVIKKWCYSPTEESGLSTDNDDKTDTAQTDGDTAGSDHADGSSDNKPDNKPENEGAAGDTGSDTDNGGSDNVSADNVSDGTSDTDAATENDDKADADNNADDIDTGDNLQTFRRTNGNANGRFPSRTGRVL